MSTHLLSTSCDLPQSDDRRSLEDCLLVVGLAPFAVCRKMAKPHQSCVGFWASVGFHLIESSVLDRYISYVFPFKIVSQGILAQCYAGSKHW